MTNEDGPKYAQRTTLLPAAAEPLADVSLASLAEAARRSQPAPPPSVSSPPRAARQSSQPPPVQAPSEPPNRAERRDDHLWLRTLGVIALSAGIGAAVSSLMGSARGALGTRRETNVAADRAPAAAPNCVPAAPVPNANPLPLPAVRANVPGAGLAPETPTISVDALPLEMQRRVTRAVDTVSLESVPSNRRVATATHGDAQPSQPSRSALSRAIGQAAYAATSCDGGPQDGKVMVTFAPSGAVQSVSLLKGFGNAALNGCVLRAFGRARVAPFSGERVQVKKSIAW